MTTHPEPICLKAAPATYRPGSGSPVSAPPFPATHPSFPLCLTRTSCAATLRTNFLTIILVGLTILINATQSKAAVVLYSWENKGPDVVVTLSGSLNLAGWSTKVDNITETNATFANDYYEPLPPFRSVYVNHQTSGGNLTYFDAGLITLSPWGPAASAHSPLAGAFVSGTFLGRIGINPLSTEKAAAYVQTSALSGDIYTIDAVYKFPNTSLEDMFNRGLPQWQAGAQIATLGNNEIRFQVVPEPAVSILLMGLASLSLIARRQRC